MNRSVLSAAVLLVALSCALLGQVTPVLNNISPTQTTAGAPGFVMTLNGTGLTAPLGARVNFGSNQLTSLLSSTATQITVQIPSTLLTAPGTVDVTVTVFPTNQAPITSGSRPFTINSAPAISTTSPLPSGVLGSPYFQTLAATGGTGSLIWSVVSGALPPGLTLSPGSGTMTGTPTNPGAYRFTARVTDSAGLFAERTFTLNIAQSGTTQGPDGTVGVAYTATLIALSGIEPWTWQITSGLPPGLTLNSISGVISGIPTTVGTFTFVAQWTDSQGLIFPNTFFIRILAASLTITTPSPLPNATVGVTYSQPFAVTGGISPYTWSFTGTLPPGLAFSAAGVLSGTPTQAGTYNFTVRVDASSVFTTKAFTLTVTVPAPATLSVTGLTDTVSPALQPTFDVQLSAAYALTITGTITLTFTPNAVNAANDPAIQFSGGGRTLNFTITAGQTRAFPTTLPSIQTGTVAGQIDLTLGSITAGGQNITPTPAPVRSVTIARAAPKINTVQVVKVTGGFNILVTGYSTPRQVTQAAFTFTPATGASLQTTQVTVPVDSVFTPWYTGNSSPQFGSQFLYTQPFTVQGSVSDIVSVSVTLTNATGTSTAVSASF